ncbi:MAG: insulinase family protein [Duncaniella sp.]|uniref:M16 family metallopeptidase n=1 Tax=Duncaniella sp. TaxID=2518496 RepID=UPI0019BFA53F|nr:pitrilysin family protein [Duncaniella sp.]MBD5334035.1 insulinase family protein [Bacteroides sp.]MDE6090530.1 insulinase family protein [Duncaniella sp.]
MIDYNRFTLSNGLRVIHNYDPTTAMVAVNVLYNVGARDEDSEMTGLAHLFEHLMFGGSVNIPDFDAEIERAGGMNNAWTSNDFTNFYDVAPARNFETLLWLESDRMLGLAFSDKALEVQRNVVIEEFKQTHLNRPYGDLSHRLREMVYRQHPYGVPTIGKDPSHIEKVTQQDVRDFFFSHYAPNNAVLAISGNVSPDQVRRGVERWFDSIPCRDVAPRNYAPEPLPDGPRETEVRGHVPQTCVVVAYPMPGYGQPGYIECDLITDILASGRSSRFYRRLLLGSDLFTSADAVITGSEEPGMLMLKGNLADPSEEAARVAVERLMAEASQLCYQASRPDRLSYTLTEARPGGVTPYEVERAINRFASDFTFSSLSYLQRAQSLAMAEMHGEDINEIVPAYRRVTTAMIANTARRVLDPRHACVLIYRPTEQSGPTA